jgi:hypothetical protein
VYCTDSPEHFKRKPTYPENSSNIHIDLSTYTPFQIPLLGKPHNIVRTSIPLSTNHSTMFTKLLALLAIDSLVSAAAVAAPATANLCNGQTYRCDATLYRVEVCSGAGWQLQALCGTPSCAHDPKQGVPHCYDQ